MKKILVLGSYGHAGCKIVKGLLQKTNFYVIATGRRAEKLDALKKQYPSERLTTQLLDTNDQENLAHHCQKSDMVINAVGPYSIGGDKIARTAIQCKTPYIDLANEQIHLHNLRAMQTDIEASGSMAFTCTGQSPGVSTLVMVHMARQVQQADTIKMYGVVGRLPTPDQALASMMGAFIEAALGSTTYVSGKHIPEPLGHYTTQHTMPAPFGTMNMLNMPTSDAILVPEAVPCQTVRNLYGFEMELPPGLVTILRWLKPHKRKWAYRLLETLAKKSLKDNYKAGLKEGFNPGGFMKVTVDGSQSTECLIKVEDNSVMTSYMPIVIAINYFQQPEKFKGLLTPTDIYTFDSFNEELDKLGWKIELKAHELSMA